MGNQKQGAAYGWPVLRMLLGLGAIAGGVFLLAREDWIRDDDQVVRYGVLVFVGSLFLVSGALGVVRLRRDRRAEYPAAWTMRRKLPWLAAAVLLAIPLAAGITFAGRVLNVVQAERYNWRDASNRGTADAYDDYDLFAVHFHRELAQSRIDEAELDRADAVLDATHAAADDDYHDRVLRWRDRHRRPHDRIHDSLRRLRATDADWFLDTFTPFREHVQAADLGYQEARFQEARTAGSVKELRLYRQEFPNGVHREEAAEALRELYREAEQRYAEMTAGGQGQPEPVAGLRELLQHLRDHDVDAHAVPVVFLPVAGIESGVIERAIQAVTGGAQVVPVGPAFTAERNAARHGSIVGRMDQALRAVVGDLFEVRRGTVDETREVPRFLVQYHVKPSGAVYSLEGQEALPVAQRQVFVGIAMSFSCTIQVPAEGAQLADDPSAGHQFTVDAEPATHFRAGYANQTADERAATAYGAMAATAFDDFERSLIGAYGLGPSPAAEPSPVGNEPVAPPGVEAPET